MAKSYLEESKENVLSDVILMSVGLNRASVFYYSNPNRFKQIMRSEKILRRIVESTKSSMEMLVKK